MASKYAPGHYDGDGCTFPDPGHFADQPIEDDAGPWLNQDFERDFIEAGFLAMPI